MFGCWLLYKIVAVLYAGFKKNYYIDVVKITLNLAK